MCGPCKTIDATMLTTAIGIDGAVKRQVRRRVARDDRSRRFCEDVARGSRDFFVDVPPIVEPFARDMLVAPFGIADL